MTKNDAAVEAVLDMALAEELGAEAPPDVWPQLQQGGGAESRSPAARWLAAALLLLGAGVVAAVMTMVRTGQEAASPLDQHRIEVDRNGPRTVAEAVARLAAVDRATVAAVAVRSAASGTWYALDQSPLEDFLQRAPNPPDLDEVTLAQLLDCLRAAAPMPAAPTDAVWTHSIRLAAPGNEGGLVLLVAAAPNSALQLAFAGAERLLAFAAPALPLPQLAPVFDAATQQKTERRGFVLGDAQLANMPTSAWQLRLHEVGADSLAALHRFQKLNQLDLTHSPLCHNAAALRLLAHGKLRSLVLCASWLDADACAAIATLPALEELFLVGPDGAWHLLDNWTAPPAPGLDDRAVAELARLGNLTELTICGGVFHDRGLGQLAQLRKLRRLGLVACEHITPVGWQAFAGHELEQLFLPGCAPPTTAANGLALLPKLQELLLGSPDADTSIAALVALPALTRLTVLGRMPVGELDSVAQLPRLRQLGLDLQPALTDADLGHLRGATQLDKLRLAGSGITKAGIAALHQALPRCTIKDELW